MQNFLIVWFHSTNTSIGFFESMYSCNLAPKWHHCQKIVKKWHQAVKLHFFNLNSTFDVPDWFNRSISRSPVNFKKIGEGHIFAISRDLVT